MREDLKREMKNLLIPALEGILREAVDEESQRRILIRAGERISALYSRS
jgi:F0F1-type ATP synthase membrane subunit b/b'